MMLPKPNRIQTIDFSFSASGAGWVHRRGLGDQMDSVCALSYGDILGNLEPPPHSEKWLWRPNSLNCVPPYIKVGFGAAINVVDWPETVGTEIFKQFVLGEIERKCFISIITPQWEFGDMIWSGLESGKNLEKRLTTWAQFPAKTNVFLVCWDIGNPKCDTKQWWQIFEVFFLVKFHKKDWWVLINKKKIQFNY